MKTLSKFLVPLITLSVFVLFFLFLNIPTADAQTPGLNISCSKNEARDNEFNYLRPYQASPCGTANKARFCSNTLTFFESFDVTGKGDCVKQDRQGSFHCNPQNGGNVMGRVEPHDLYIELTDSNFPIFGNTEDSLDDAQKVNEYASWYLSGVNDKLENKDATEEQIVNFSGPVKKLIPSMIQDVQRIKIIESATKETTYIDEQTGEKVTEAENHDQKVVDNERLSSWEGDLSFIRSAIDSAGNILSGALLGGVITNELNNAGIDLSIKAGWNKRIPPLPWSDENGKPFESDILYQKAYQEWQGKSCAILPIIGLQCIDNPFISNKYADLWHYVPLSNNSDKRGANYLLTDDGPNYVPSKGTDIENAFHDTYTNANLYFAHTQEVKDLEELLNSTYRPSGYKSEPIPETTEEIKRGINTAVGDSAHTSNPAYEGLDCSNLVVRTNKGDDLFPGDPKELSVKGVTYTITGAECEEVFKEVRDCNHPPRSNPCGGDPNSGACCTVKQSSLKCIAEVGIVLQLGTKTPWADEIFADTVADSGSSFRKIFPKVEEGAPVSCIADIPAVTTVTYDATKSEKPKGGDQTFKVKNIPFDGGSEGTELTFAHVGSVYEYFLKGIQTALRPKGYGEPILDGQLCKNGVKCGELPELPKASGSCNLGGISPRVGDIPQSLKDIVSAAAETYKVPPNLILGVMYGEGLFDGSAKRDWTEENVKSWATCEKVPNCNESGFDDKFMGFAGTFDNILSKSTVKADIQKLDPNRTTFSQCNLLDAIYAMAWDLHNNAAGGKGLQCFGLDLGGKIPTSCSWDDTQYISAIKIFENGYDQGCFTKPGSCATGGSNDALCTATDVCETVGSSGNTSHTACLWDVGHGK